MQTESRYNKTFVSDGLTREKYEELHGLAVSILGHKNAISREICSDIFAFFDKNPLTFVTEMRTKYKGVVNSNFDKQLYKQVIDAYQNKFDAVIRNIKFEKIEFLGFEFYKRDTKDHRKGDFKKVATKRTSTTLSTCLTYLARYGNEDTIDYIKEQLETPGLNENKATFYREILGECGKFGFDRLMRLALQRRDRVIRKYSYPIEFKSLSFGGRSRKKKIVDFNGNYKSKINAFISLSFPTRKTMDIPVKYSKYYHGPMSDYTKASNDYDYVICFDELRKQVKVNIAKSGERYIPEVTPEDKVVGVDVNIKHNLFSLSDGTVYDFDRDLLTEFCKVKRQIDTLKEADKNYQVGKRRQHKLDTLRLVMKRENQQLIANMCKTLAEQGVRHVVMEDIDGKFGKSHVKDETLDGINFNDIVKFVGLGSLKDEVEHIARKYDITVSTVHACYTSKMCPVCGCIEDENRPNQETFDCVECGHKDNADVNAAINIRNRVLATVLRDKLLKQLGNGAYEPKRMKREKVKEVLLSYRTSLEKDGESKFY